MKPNNIQYNLMAIADVIALIRDEGVSDADKMDCISYAYDCFKMDTRVDFNIVETMLFEAREQAKKK